MELLAPAGNFETLTTAINAGCDSVYFGVGDLNMRSSSKINFEIDDLEKIVKQCRLNNVKAFLALNTVLYNNEISKVRAIVDLAGEVGISAIIASDMAVITYARDKKVPVHISTQLSISNSESLKFYSQFAERFVLARELTLEQITEIQNDIVKQNIIAPNGKLLELEVFIHGALCVAVSGRCWMSLYHGAGSANRGKCMQPCRRKYKITDIVTGKELIVDNNYVMSSADLCTIGMLKEIVDTGVTALKIEGRGKPPEYVDTVVRTYKKALDLIEAGNYSVKDAEKFRKELGTVYTRGQSEGMYRGVEFVKWAGMDGNKATHERVQAGKVLNYYPKSKVAYVEILNPVEIKNDDQYLITGNTTGLIRGIIKEMHIDTSVEIQQKVKLQNKAIELPLRLVKVRKNDSLFLWKRKGTSERTNE